MHLYVCVTSHQFRESLRELLQELGFRMAKVVSAIQSSAENPPKIPRVASREWAFTPRVFFSKIGVVLRPLTKRKRCGKLSVENFTDLLMGLFRGTLFCHGGGARKQPTKQPTECQSAPWPALVGGFPSLPVDWK